MNTSRTMTWVVNWELPWREFRTNIRSMIEAATDAKKVIALPIKVEPESFSGILAALLSQVDCMGCLAQCCRQNVDDSSLLHVNKQEYPGLAEKYGAKHFVVSSGGNISLPMPCPFLVGRRCSIYEDRPLVCVFYPFQPEATSDKGEFMAALASECPEARRVAVRVYAVCWQIRHRMLSLNHRTRR